MILKIILAFEIRSGTQVEWRCACSFISRVSWRLHASSFLYIKWVWEFLSKSWSCTLESRAKLRSIWIGIWLTWNIRYLLMYFMHVFPFTVIVRVFTCGSFSCRMRPMGWTWIECSQNNSKVAKSKQKCPCLLHPFAIACDESNIITGVFQDCWGTVTSQVSNSCVGTVTACSRHV